MMNGKEEWCVLGINTELLPNDMSFYSDTTRYDGVSIYTFDNIPPNAIELLDTITV